MAEAEEQPERYTGEALPAWSLPAAASSEIDIGVEWPERVTREWAWGGSTGAGVTVCILDSGVEPAHPLIGPVDGAVVVSVDAETGEASIDAGGIVRALAPDCASFSVRVLGAGYTGSGPVLIAGLRWAIEQGFDVINMSLSTTKRQFAEVLHELADSAYFKRTVLVASAHNMPVESYPWRFAAVISVGSHEENDPQVFYYNPAPPVEFFARGVNVEVPWLGGETTPASGNSFATPHMSGMCALIMAKHRELTPFQLKSVLFLTSSNVGGET